LGTARNIHREPSRTSGSWVWRGRHTHPFTTARDYAGRTGIFRPRSCFSPIGMDELARRVDELERKLALVEQRLALAPPPAAVAYSLPAQRAPAVSPPPAQRAPAVYPPPAAAADARLGLTWLNRLGALVLLTGLALAALWAHERGYLTPPLRNLL